MTSRAKIEIRHAVILAGAAAAVLGVQPALAQAEPNAAPASPNANRDDENDIIVTALKRATTAQETPLAITVATGDRLAAMNIVDSDSLQRISPGLTIRESAFTGSRLSIRNIRSSGEPTVGLYYDETPVIGSAGVGADAGGTTPNIRLFDVERVEILRGPQGTLYGSSSEAGTVRVIFKKPDTTDLGAEFNGKMFDVRHGDLGFETQGMFNLPVIGDKLAVRAVGYYQALPGYVDSTRFNRNDLNRARSWGGRVTVRATPVDGLTIDGLAVIQDTHARLNDYNLAVGVYKQAYESLQPSSDRFEIYSGTLNYDAGPVILTAVGSHAYRDFDYAYDTSAFLRLTGSRFPPGSPQNAAFNALAPSVAESPQITKTDTAELRLANENGGAIHATGGFFYSNRKGDFVSNIRRTSTADGSVLPLTSTTLLGQRIIADQLKQTAGFAEATVDLTSRFSVTGGLRRYHYRREVYGLVTVPNPFLSLAAGPATTQNSSESGWLYKANVSFKPAEHVLLYATVSNGQRPGGLNQTLGLPAALQSYQSDEVRNYEAGFKTELLDRRVTFNADVFQIDWDDIQTTGTLPSTPFIFIANASKARARGVEVEASFYPAEGLTLQMSGSYIDAHLTANQANPGLVAAGLKGDPIPAAPKVTLQGGIQYSRPLTSALRASLRADGYFQSASWIGFRHNNALYERLPRYATLSLRAGVGGIKDEWNVSVYVVNATDNDAAVAKFGNASPVFGNQPRTISLTPRTVGVELSKRF